MNTKIMVHVDGRGVSKKVQAQVVKAAGSKATQGTDKGAIFEFDTVAQAHQFISTIRTYGAFADITQ